MRLVLTVVLLLCLFELSCTRQTVVDRPSASPSPSTPTPARSVEPAGASMPKEAGDAAPEEFAGMAGTAEVKRTGMKPAILKAIRPGRHPNFDRVVFEFEGNQVPGYRVEYVDKPVRTCGAGEVVQIGGYGYLLVQMTPAQAHTDDGRLTISELELAPNLTIIKELKRLCDFEADVQWVLGLSAPNRYRVLELSNPARLVVDIRK